MFQNTELHYDRYLREVIDYLEKDAHFKEKLQKANLNDVKVFVCVCASVCVCDVLMDLCTSCLQQGKLSKELDFVHHGLRTKLDELKREEMNRLRMLIKAKHDQQDGGGKYPACI